MYKYFIICLLSLFIFTDIIAIEVFGKQETIKSTSCLFEGNYTPNKSYDIEPFISYTKVELLPKSIFHITLKVEKLAADNFVGISFYDTYDLANAPIKDLNHTGNDAEVDASAFVQMKAFSGKGSNILLAPVVFKDAYRGKVGEKEKYITPFASRSSITDLEGNILVGEKSFFTQMMSSLGGKGAYHVEGPIKKVTTNKDNEYEFLLHANSNFSSEIFMIVAITKISLIPSQRGLRSPILTGSFNWKNCV